jgi:hypothetical protein
LSSICYLWLAQEAELDGRRAALRTLRCQTAFKERIAGEPHGTSAQADQVASRYRDGIHAISTDELMRRMVDVGEARGCAP